MAQQEKLGPIFVQATVAVISEKSNIARGPSQYFCPWLLSQMHFKDTYLILIVAI